MSTTRSESPGSGLASCGKNSGTTSQVEAEDKNNTSSHVAEYHGADSMDDLNNGEAESNGG